MGTFNLASVTGHREKYGAAYGHLGATYGYQSITSYYPEANFAMAVASNIETDYQRQGMDVLCVAYNGILEVMLNQSLNCSFVARGYYTSECRCARHPVEAAAAVTAVIV